jgi:hypothetical protein
VYDFIACNPSTVTATGAPVSTLYCLEDPVFRTNPTVGRVALPGATATQYTVPGKLFLAERDTSTVAFCADARTATEVILGTDGTMSNDGREVGRVEGCSVYKKP